MRLARFIPQSRASCGAVTDAGIIDLAPRTKWPTLRDVITAQGLPHLADLASGLSPDLSPADIIHQIPVPNPDKIICVGVNFPDRNAEYKDGTYAPPLMSLFPRFSRSFTGAGQPLIRPPESPQLDDEGEVAILIGKPGRRIPEAQAMGLNAAITLANEGTIRDWVRHAKFNVTQGMNRDNSGSVGPWIVPLTDPAQLDDIKIETRVNGDLRQSDRTSRMIFSFRRIVAYISTFTTLVPGDTILCGTPTKAGARFDPPIWLKPGDVVTVTADGIGIPTNPNRGRGGPVLTQTQIAAAALAGAERSRVQIGLLSLQHPQMTMDDAYAVQAALVALRHAKGRRTIGWKIGLTSKAMQPALNIAIPDSGVLLADMVFDDNANIPATRFIQPRIEAELAFLLKSPLQGPNVTEAQVMNATDYILPALEILDTRIRRADPATGKTRTIVDTISDNGANAGIIAVCRDLRPDAFDPRWAGAIVMRNAEVEETGLGAGVLNQPARGLAWLPNRLCLYGQQIEAGQIVLSGSFIRPIKAQHGDTILADFGPMGTVGCHFS